MIINNIGSKLIEKINLRYRSTFIAYLKRRILIIFVGKFRNIESLVISFCLNSVAILFPSSLNFTTGWFKITRKKHNSQIV